MIALFLLSFPVLCCYMNGPTNSPCHVHLKATTWVFLVCSTDVLLCSSATEQGLHLHWLPWLPVFLLLCTTHHAAIPARCFWGQTHLPSVCYWGPPYSVAFCGTVVAALEQRPHDSVDESPGNLWQREGERNQVHLPLKSHPLAALSTLAILLLGPIKLSARWWHPAISRSDVHLFNHLATSSQQLFWKYWLWATPFSSMSSKTKLLARSELKHFRLLVHASWPSSVHGFQQQG